MVAKEDNKPLISVIVPIYNVEKYIRKCLDSLKTQTMEQIEVICIDDGSTDSSGKIADEYQSDEWPRFKVLHTENRGLSAARNRGIDESEAEWLMFVDSDDWVDKDFCRVPYEAAIERYADLVYFDFYRITRLGKVKKPRKNNAPTGIVDEMTAQEYGNVVVWNKLYRASLFETVRYPEGRVYEGTATTHKFVHEAQRIVSIEEFLYYYRFRKGSITQMHTAMNKRDGAIAAWENYLDYVDYGYSLDILKVLACSSAIGIIANTDKSYINHLEAIEVLKLIDGIPDKLSVKKKIALIVWKINPPLFYMLCRMTRRI